MDKREREMRAADADREHVAEKLRTALNEGRLSLNEYDERLRDTYAARTYADLQRLLTDLPAGQVVPVADTLPAVANPVPQWLAMVWGPWLKANAICWGIWVAIWIFGSGGVPFPWPIFVTVPWGIVLGVTTVSGLAGGEPRKWADKRARKRAKRAKSD